MYDLDGDDKISKEELLAVLTMMVGANISEDQLVSIAERTIMEADDDKDNLISFDEFCKVLERTDVEQKMSIRFLSWKTLLTPNFYTLKIINEYFLIMYCISFIKIISAICKNCHGQNNENLNAIIIWKVYYDNRNKKKYVQE